MTSVSGIPSFSGLGSGIDFTSITDAIVAGRAGPLNQLTAEQSTFQQKSDALKQLNTALLALNSATSALTDQTLGTGLSASSTASSVVTATAASGAANGSIAVEVDHLATNLSEASPRYATAQTPLLT